MRNLFILSFLFLLSCQKIYQDKFVFCGTYVRVISPHKEAAKIAQEEFKRLEKIFNFYDPNSELSLLNSTYNFPFPASSELIKCIEEAKKVYQLSGGFFDVGKARLYNFWKDIIKKKRKIKDKDFNFLKKTVDELKRDSFLDVVIDKKNRTITLKKKGLKVDLGGIAKGFIIDKVVERLKKKGIKSALIDAGGDIFCLGKYKGRKWRVGIKDPKNKSRVIYSLSLSNQAVATSGSYEQFFEFSGRSFSHLIDPFSGFPVNNNILSVTVVAPSATLADSLATTFFIMGYEKTKEFIKRHKDLNIDVFLVLQEDNKEKLYHLK